MNPEVVVADFLDRISVKRKTLKKVVRTCFEKYGLPGEKWPEWCFIPFNFWYVVFDAWENKIGKFYKDIPEMSSYSNEEMYINMCYTATAVLAWRYTKGIYRFDPELYFELTNNVEVSDKIPSDVLMRLPEWCVYVDEPQEVMGLFVAHGYFAYIDHRSKEPVATLVIILVMRANFSARFVFPLEGTPINEQIENTFNVNSMVSQFNSAHLPEEHIKKEHYHHSLAMMVSGIVNQLLYLCADKPDISSRKYPEATPCNPSPVKNHKGYSYFIREKPRIWTVGAEVSENIRRAVSSGYRDKKGKVSPHWRRGHYHGVWRGPRNNPHFHLNWWPPIPIGASEEIATETE